MASDLRSAFLDLAARQPGGEAILAPGRQSLRFADLPLRLDAVRDALHAAGVGHGDLVATALPNGADTAMCLVALQCFATAVPLNPAYSEHEFNRYLQRVRPRALILPEGDGATARRVAASLDIAVLDLVAHSEQPCGVFSLRSDLQRTPARIDWNGADDVTLVLLTSGSTGLAKLVPVPARILLSYASAMQGYYSLRPTDRNVHIMPMFHGHGLKSSLMGPLLIGAGVVCPTQFDVPTFFACIEAFRPTWYSAGFTMHRAILDGIDPYRAQAKAARLRFIRSGSGRLDPRVMLGLEEAFGAPVLERYGMSETCTLTYNPPPPAVRRPGTVGIVGTNSVRIVDHAGTVLGPNQEGEIVARGPSVVDRYWDDPKATSTAFIDGWFHTGDLGRFDKDGYLTVTGRIKDLINRGGEKISPAEIENELLEHPAVAEVCVFPVPHLTLGQEVAAAVVLRSAGALDETALITYARERLASFKVPRRVAILDELPLAATGKTQRAAMAQLLGLDNDAAAVRRDTGQGASAQSALDIELASLWASTLGLAVVEPDADFFLLGGDSLRAVRLLGQVQEAFGVNLSLANILDQASTVAGMARCIEASRACLAADAGGMSTPVNAQTRIPRRDPSAPCPMSFQQRRLWFIDRLYPGKSPYHINAAIRMTGPLKIDALANAINGLIARHEALRTTFDVVDGDPCQIVSPRLTIPLPVRDLRGMPPTEAESETRRILKDEVSRPFDLTLGPLLRAFVVRLADEEHTLLLVQHHIVTDAWSSGIFNRELAALYDAFARGHESPLRALAIHYPDYAAWQRQTLSRARLEELLGYWRKRLAGAPAGVSLPTDRSRHREHDSSGSRMDRTLPARLMHAFFELNRKEKTSPYLAWLAVFNVLLSRCSGDDDIVVGVPSQGRDRTETLGVIGFFLNMLPVRTDLSGDPTFRELLGRVHKAAAADLAHHDLPFERMVEDLHPDRRVGETPLFNTTCILLDRSSRVARPGWRQDIDDFDRGTAPFDLSLMLSEVDDGHRMTLRFNSTIFDRTTIERLLSQLRCLFEGIVADPDRRISEVPMLLSDERHEIVVAWNQTETDYSGDASLQALFEAQVDAAPGAVAVSDGLQTVTYAELDARANRIAHMLRERGIGPNAVVGVCLERSVEFVVAILAIVKVGGAYLPLDTKYPESRKQFMLGDAASALLLTTTTQMRASAGLLPSTMCLDAVAEIHARSAGRLAPSTTGDDLAYVMYTSGSTGQPKGVAVRQRGVSRLVINTNYLAFSPATVIAQLSNVAFDAATFEIWGALLNGGRLEILDDDTVLQPDRLAVAVAARGITAMFLTTALFNEIARAKPDAFQGLGTLLVGGEAADPSAFRLVLGSQPPQHLVNIYGPTETTTFAAYHEVTEVPPNPMSIPIGRPISNTRLYVLSANLSPVPIGCQGELCIAGPGVARGYLGLPELTSKRFVPDVFSNRPGDVLYRTGDRARYRADGSIEMLGRLDRQIKLRGFRIEPAEIESVLIRHPHVATAIVTTEGEGAHRRLVGYLTNGSAVMTSPSELRAFLRSTLPDFMVPDAFVWLERLPLTPSGKIDRSALSDSHRLQCRPAPQLPSTPTERIVADIWAQQLALTSVGVEDDFFELGGHSLLAVNLIAALEVRFGVSLSPALLFKAPTVAAIAKAIDDRGTLTRPTRLVPVQTEGSNPPIFALPGGGGSIIAYDRLARELGRNQPFYGLEHPDLEGGDVPHDRIESLAESFVQELRDLHPGQPCVLIGACSGAIVAFELARLLMADGRHVARVVMLDPSITGTTRRAGAEFVPGWRQLMVAQLIATRLTSYARDVRQLKGSARRQFLREKGRQIGKIFRRRRLLDENARELNRIRTRHATVRALRMYSPRPYGGAVTLIAGMRFHSPEHAKSIEPWRELCTGSLEIHHIAVQTSGEMLRPPAISELVRQLRDTLSRTAGLLVSTSLLSSSLM